VVIFEADEPSPTTVGQVRRAFRQWAEEHDLDGVALANAVLLVSELATNAVRHARTAYTVAVEATGDSVRIEVFDRDTRMPVLQGTDGGAIGGRGMHIVATVADEWGSSTETRDGIDGKVVWVVVPRRGPEAGEDG